VKQREAIIPNENTVGKGEFGVPDLDNECYIRIDMQLFECFYKYGFNKNQLEVVLFLIRKTYGWQKTEECLTLDMITKETGINKSSASRTLSSLLDENVILRKKRNLPIRDEKLGFATSIDRYFYSLNKKWKTWKKNKGMVNTTDEIIKNKKRSNRQSYYYIYILHNKTNNLYKIGVAKNVKEREREK